MIDRYSTHSWLTQFLQLTQQWLFTIPAKRKSLEKPCSSYIQRETHLKYNAALFLLAKTIVGSSMTYRLVVIRMNGFPAALDKYYKL